jgi:hypothetical protein
MLGSDSRLYVPATALATTTKIGSINKLSGNTTDFLDGTNTFQNLAAAVQPTIWSARLRSFNAIGNPTFEIDQRNAGTLLTNPASGILVVDRWQAQKSGTMTYSTLQAAPPPYVLVPGTNFAISRSFLQLKLLTAQATLGAGDFMQVSTQLEGTRFRELSSDVHSVSILIGSSVAPLSFALGIHDPASTRSLVKLCTISTANTFVLIQLPNLPVFPSSGSFVSTPGSVGYSLTICFACGSTYMAPAADVWQNGNFIGAPGMSNFTANAVNSTISIAFVQHEPGALCTTPIDCPFTQNLDDCLRYFQKSYDYGTKPSTVVAPGQIGAFGPSGWSQVMADIVYPKLMAKSLTPVLYSPTTGAPNAIRASVAAVDRTLSGFSVTGSTGFAIPSVSVAAPSNEIYYFHYTADTGW